MRFPFCRNRDSLKNGTLISIRRTSDGFHPGLFNTHIYHLVWSGIIRCFLNGMFKIKKFKRFTDIEERHT